jgi:hypothetical protein
MRIALLAGAAALLAANASAAQPPARDAGYYSSRKIQRLCAAPGGTASNNECRTYVAGVVDVLGTGEAAAGQRACIPRATVLNTIILVVRLYQTERPGIAHQNAAKTIADAVSEKWPCR